MLARLKPKPGEDKHELAAVQGARPRGRHRHATSSPTRPESVKSGRRIEELVAPPKPPAKPASSKPGALPGAVQGAGAGARRAAARDAGRRRRRTGDDWLHEIKFDGYRTLAHVVGAARCG